MSQTQQRHPQVINVDESRETERLTGARFGFRNRPLADRAGGRSIGCTWYEIPPGRTAFPYHFHRINEEAMFVLEGNGTVRIGAQTVPIRAGDWVSFPIGPDNAHQVINDGDAPLRLLALSTKVNGDVVGYPDSKKIGAVGAPPGTKLGDPVWMRVIVREGTSVEYFDGEQTD
jgi:uncharacterized cupin superfamily protein